MDTVVCIDALPITLSAEAGFTSYLWDDGSTGITRNISAGGTYTAISNRICERFVFDTFRVTAVAVSRDLVLRDSALCFPGSYRLSAPPGYTKYTWDDGSASSSRVVTTAGRYVIISEDNCQIRVDTFNVVNAPIAIDLGPDTTVCSNYFINVPIERGGTTYRWQDGSRDTFFSAHRTGAYYVTVNKNGCIASDTVNVTFRRLQQNIPDVFVCKEDSIFYPVQCTVPPDGSVMWNDGITTTARTFRTSGTWWVEIRAGDCAILDTVRVTTEQCDCWHLVPSAFTPNLDGKNDEAMPLIQAGCPLSGYQFIVYNRWGQEVFSTMTPGTGWDGNFRGQPADMGVYMYQLTFFAGSNQRRVNATGDITLIR
jgi:gliding motility-associated-like protein